MPTVALTTDVRTPRLANPIPAPYNDRARVNVSLNSGVGPRDVKSVHEDEGALAFKASRDLAVLVNLVARSGGLDASKLRTIERRLEWDVSACSCEVKRLLTHRWSHWQSKYRP